MVALGNLFLLASGPNPPQLEAAMKTDGKERLLTARQAADLLGVVPSRAPAWGVKGLIPEYRHSINSFSLYNPNQLHRVLRKLRSPNVATDTRRLQLLFEGYQCPMRKYIPVIKYPTCRGCPVAEWMCLDSIST